MTILTSRQSCNHRKEAHDHPPIDPTELSKLQSRWRRSALGVLEVIHGYSELLMQNAFGELSPPAEVVDKIHQYSLRAVAAWQFMGAYIAVRYEQKPSTWQSINLQSLVERVLVNLAQVEGIQDVHLKPQRTSLGTG